MVEFFGVSLRWIGRAGGWKAVRNSLAAVVMIAAVFAFVRPANAQLIEKYYPANVPAYQDWLAGAQDAGPDEGYAPLGVRLGNVIVRPEVTEGLGYDSNLTGTSGGAASALVQSNGAVTLDTDWSRNALDASITVQDTRYLDVPSRSFTNWTASAGGDLVYGQDDIRAGYAHIVSVSLPTDVGTFGLAQPVSNQVDDLRVSDTLGPGPLILVPALVGQLYRFSPLTGGTLPASLGLSNRETITGSITAGYSFAGGHNLVVLASDTGGFYDRSTQAGLPENYNDLSILAGLEYRQSAVWAYRALVGYEMRDAKGRAVAGSHVSAPAAELDVIWSPDRLTSITAQLGQSLQNAPTSAGQGLTEVTALIDINRAVRRNVTLDLKLGFERAAFSGNQETQSSVTAAASLSWNLSRAMSLRWTYDFTKADDSRDAQFRYSRHQILVQASYHL